MLVAGGGIGGLVLALAAKHRGYEVKVFEKDLSAVRGEGRHRGPIQLLSGALAVLETIDQSVARQIMEAGCVTLNCFQLCWIHPSMWKDLVLCLMCS